MYSQTRNRTPVRRANAILARAIARSYVSDVDRSPIAELAAAAPANAPAFPSPERLDSSSGWLSSARRHSDLVFMAQTAASSPHASISEQVGSVPHMNESVRSTSTEAVLEEKSDDSCLDVGLADFPLELIPAASCSVNHESESTPVSEPDDSPSSSNRIVAEPPFSSQQGRVFEQMDLFGASKFFSDEKEEGVVDLSDEPSTTSLENSGAQGNLDFDATPSVDSVRSDVDDFCKPSNILADLPAEFLVLNDEPLEEQAEPSMELPGDPEFEALVFGENVSLPPTDVAASFDAIFAVSQMNDADDVSRDTPRVDTASPAERAAPRKDFVERLMSGSYDYLSGLLAAYAPLVRGGDFEKIASSVVNVAAPVSMVAGYAYLRPELVLLPDAPVLAASALGVAVLAWSPVALAFGRRTRNRAS